MVIQQINQQVGSQKADSDDTPKRDKISNEMTDISCEKDYQSFLETHMVDEGWEVHREVEQDDGPYQPDFLVRHPQYGNEWIGIEAKYVTADNRAKKLAQAHIQITEKYWNRTYFGEYVDLWAYSPFKSYIVGDSGGSTDPSVDQQRFLCEFGIGYLSPHGYTPRIDFNFNNSECKLPAFDSGYGISDRNREVDMDRVLELSTKKRREIESYRP